MLTVFEPMGAETSKGLPLVSGQDSPHDLPTQGMRRLSFSIPFYCLLFQSISTNAHYLQIAKLIWAGGVRTLLTIQ